MKTISKRFLKASLAMLLAVVMLFGTTITGFAAVVDNADTSANVDVADTNASVDLAEAGLTIPSGSGNLVMFNNTLGWSNVYLYTRSTDLWNGNNGCTTSGLTAKTMTRISGTNYWYAYISTSYKYVLFLKDKQDNYGNVWSTSASYRADYSTSRPCFTPVPWSNQNTNSTNYYSKGSWSKFDDTTTELTIPSGSNNLVIFNNTLGWSEVYFYSKSSNFYTNSNGCSTSGMTGTRMTNISGTNYWYIYTSTTSHMLFLKAKQDGYGNVWDTAAAYKEDYNTDRQIFTPSTTAVETTNNTSYYSNGTWSKYAPATTKYTVNFVDHDGTPISTQQVEEGKTPTTPANPTRTGYTFTGWDPAVGAITANTTYTAQYTKNTYTVKFIDINGNQIGSTQTVEHDATPTAPTAPTITGKTFAGWNPTVGAVTADTTYQATYTDNTYTITAKQVGGTGTVTLGKTSAKYGDTVTLKVTPPTSYKIASITGGGLNIGECESYNGSFTMPASNVTINVTYVLAGSCAPHFAYGDQSLVLGAEFTNTASTNDFCEGDEEGNKTFEYTSSDTSVATVNASTGLVTAKKPGSTTITATCSCGTTATYNVTVKTPSVSVPAMTLDVNADGTADPTITDGPASGYTITYSGSSANFNVSESGTVTAIKPGSGTVNYTMTYGGNTVATGSFNVTVSIPAFSIRPLTDNLIVGQTMTADFETTSTPAAKSVTLTSADTSKVTISGKKATAVAAAPEGVTITAAFKFNDSYTDYATAKVIVAAPSITANPTSVALEFGEGATATSKTVTLDTNAAAGNGTGDDITVTSANSNVATATLSGSTLTINATGIGSTTVTAKFHDATVEIPVTVTQYDPYFTVYFTNNKYSEDPYIYYWNDGGSGTFKSMVYIGKNGDGQKIFAYRFNKGSEPDNLIFTNQNGWNGSKTNDIDLDKLTTTKDYVAIYLDGSSSPYTGKDWTDDFILGMSTISVADVVVPVGSTVSATATVSDNSRVRWSIADSTKATVTNSTSATNSDSHTTNVTGVAPGETTITARVFVDNTISSIKTLPGDYATNSASYDYISTTATATVTVGSVDYDITAGAAYSNDGTAYVDGTNGGTATITVDGVNKGTSAAVAHGKEYTLTATANSGSGYRFVGWYNADELVSTEDSYTTTAKAAASYTARFIKTHNVSVAMGEGIASVTYNGVEYTEFDNITVDAGATVTVNATAAANYKFSHWDLVYGDFTDVVNAAEYTIDDVQNSITLTANAVPIYTASATATTRYTSAGGSVTVNGQASPIQVENGETVTFNASATRTFKFVGWFRDAGFTDFVSADATYEANMTSSGLELYALFVKDMVLYNSDTSEVVELAYDYNTDTYSVNTTAIGNNFKVSENVQGYNAIGADKVDVLNGNITGATIGGNAQKYILTPDLENYDPSEGISFRITPDGDNTYTMNITLAEAEKVAISVNGTKVADKAIGSTFSYEIDAPDGQYLSNATITPSVDFTIEGDTITFTVPDANVNIVPSFADYSYVELSDSTGITATGLKTGYKAGEAVSITLSPASEATTISQVVADYNGAVITQNGDNWTVTIASMPADTTVTLTPTVDAKFVMNYGTQVAIGNYGTGVTTNFGTVTMKIGDTALANGGYAGPNDTVTYTATESNANYTFAGFYSDADCKNVLSYNATYEVKPTKDTTVYTLWARRQYMDFDSGTASIVKELVYNKEERVYTLSTVLADNSSANAISKGAWFQVTNDKNDWTGTTSYHHYGSDFSVTHNANGFDATITWNDGGNSWKLSTSAANDTAIKFILTPTGNTAIDFSAQVGEVGSYVYLSSGRLDLPGSYNATVFEATSKFTTEGIENPTDTYVANEGENREKYKRISLTDAQTISFETEITGTAAANYEVDSYVVYHIDTESYSIVTPVSLGNNKYSGSVLVDGPCYIVPIYFLTPEYAEANNLAEIDIYFDATAIKDKSWGPFVACYAWGTNSAEYLGGWSGQMMIPDESGESFYTMLTVPKAGATGAPSIPNGVTFNNYTQSTVPGSNPGAFGISATQYQCYDYREPITLYEAGYDVITFVAKDSTDGYHGDRANGVTANTVTSSTTDIFTKYKFDYLYSRDGETPMDFNGDVIENPVDLSSGAKADYYVISKGDITYDPNGTKYVGDANFDADWAVDWYVFDSTGKYLTKILSTAMWHDKDNNLDDLYTYLHEALNTNEAGVAGKTVAISYEHENNAGHQVSYDGQWYGNYLDDTVNAQVKVGFQTGENQFTINPDTENPHIADYGEGYLDDLNGGLFQTLDISLDYGAVDLHAVRKDGYTFIGWYTQKADGTYHKISSAFDYHTYISMNETYYAMFREIAEGEVIINHSTYINNDPAIPSHGGVSEMSIVVTDNTDGTVYNCTPSTSRTSVAFEGVEGHTYTVQIITTPLMNGEFFAWYTDSYTVDGTKTYEEVFTDADSVNSTSQVVAQFDYEYSPDSQKVINIYSDVKRVTNKADLYYKYYNRFGELRTYTVKDVVLTDDECMGFIGNGFNPYVPAYITAYTFLASNGDEVVVYGEDRYNEYVANGYTYLGSYNKISAYAPNSDVTEVFDGTVTWTIADNFITTEKSLVTLIADQGVPTYTINYSMAGQSGKKTGYYNDLVMIDAPQYDEKGNKFSYWYEPATGEILTYSRFYNYRIVENKTIEAVYGKTDLQEWVPSINSVTYTREFADGGDYIYTDYLLAFNNINGKELKAVQAAEGIEYGLMLIRNSSYYIENADDITYPSVDDTMTNYLKRVAGEKKKNMAIPGTDGNTYNCYYYNLSNSSMTNFNRIDYYLKYDNNKEVSTGHYYRDYAFTAVAYIIVDGEVYLSNPKSVDFFELGNTAATN